MRKLKIAVVGCGAVGCYYGARLLAAGHEVHFLLRSDFEQVSRDGVSIDSPLGSIRVRPASARAPAEIGASDLIIVALKTTANDQLRNLLPPLLGPHSIVLTLQNGLGNEETLAQIAGPERVMGGLCFVCLNRIAPGKILHLAHGQVVLGEFALRESSRLAAIAEMFRDAGIVCEATPHLLAARWEKLVWNIPFNGLGVAAAAGSRALKEGKAPSAVVAPCLTTDQLLAHPFWEISVTQLMREVVNAAQAQALPLTTALVEKQLNLTRSMGPYKPSTLLDFERHQPIEIESMFLLPLDRAKAAGADVPVLERLCGVLKDLASLRELNSARPRLA